MASAGAVAPRGGAPEAGAMAVSRRARELGQNFLRDPNILGVIGRVAELEGEDVVLEIGGGQGVLSAYLAERVAWVHVVEVDEHLREALGGALAPFANVSLCWGDAMRVDLSAMRPGPTKVVANLPYGIAAGVVLRTIEELPGVGLWVVMVQREVGERLAAAPGSGVYGISSVLAQLAGEVRVVRHVPRTVFQPVPNVDSVLVQVVRTGPAASPALREFIRGAFAHRRKALAGSLVLAGVGGDGERGDEEAGGGTLSGGRAGRRVLSREEIRAALVELGHPADVRAERLSPGEFEALARTLGL
jgi:16S rRNA (adenine1518-N6/adenine1519-N6)-dimethyltransferase